MESERCQVTADCLERGLVLLEKPRVPRAATERFDADRACTGIRVHKRAAFDPRLQNIEQCFAQAVGRRPSGFARNAYNAPGTKLSSDNPHQPTVTNP